MFAARMIVEMVQHHRALTMVTAPPGQRGDFGLELLDQSLLVRGDDVHFRLLARH